MRPPRKCSTSASARASTEAFSRRASLNLHWSPTKVSQCLCKASLSFVFKSNFNHKRVIISTYVLRFGCLLSPLINIGGRKVATQIAL